MKLNNYLHTNQVQSKQEILDNINYSVFPVIMMTEGVHAGSGGPVLYTQEALSSFYQTWNGTPITLGHPKDKDNYVSANAPLIYQSNVVGTVFNTVWEDGKLKAELWLRDDKINALAPTLLNSLRTGMQLDVSTGLFDNGLQEQGIFNGKEYVSIAKDIRPDHLALLPGESGACSWADGCGVRANQKKELKMKRTTPVKTNQEDAQKKELDILIPDTIETLEVNAKQSYTEVIEAIRSKINALDMHRNNGPVAQSESTYHYTRAVFPDYVVYQKEGSEGVGTFKRNFSYKDGEVTWTSEPVPVTEKITYTEIKTNEENEMKTMQECCPLKVDELIKANSKFKEEDKEMLLNLTEDNFARIIDVSAPTIVEKEVIKEVKVNAEPKDVTFEQLLANADASTKESIKYGQTLIAKEREQLVARIKTNASNTFSDEELAAFDLQMLGKVAQLSPTPVNWMPNAGNRTIVNADMPEPLPDTENVWADQKAN